MWSLFAENKCLKKLKVALYRPYDTEPVSGRQSSVWLLFHLFLWFVKCQQEGQPSLKILLKFLTQGDKQK